MTGKFIELREYHIKPDWLLMNFYSNFLIKLRRYVMLNP
ncbi:MAG: type II toxin-antitoxin system YafQ family toxin [Lachnospiraceae bacterium]|nr:type II toxin-antitoxin system YafQ family toxin [Lachnospiraceae bacterium]